MLKVLVQTSAGSHQRAITSLTDVILQRSMITTERKRLVPIQIPASFKGPYHDYIREIGNGV